MYTKILYDRYQQESIKCSNYNNLSLCQLCKLKISILFPKCTTKLHIFESTCLFSPVIIPLIGSIRQHGLQIGLVKFSSWLHPWLET